MYEIKTLPNYEIKTSSNYKIKTLSNGIRVVLEKIPYVRSISFGVWVKNGSNNESDKTNGISHFIEHMLFKGTINRTAKDIANEMDAIGGQLNAYTSKDYTCYYTRTLDTHINTALDVMSDMFLNSLFDKDDIKKELNVILEEIDMYEDSPEELVHDLLQEAVWEDMPLGRPILGTEESISLFSTEIFKDYYSKQYTPQNIVIAVAGHFEIDNMIENIEKYFSSWKNTNSHININKKSIYKPSIIFREKEIEQIHICLGFQGLNILSEDIFVLNIFNTIFGDSMSSRLFQRIREDNGLVYSIYSDMCNYIDDGLFTIYSGMAPAQVEKVFKIINEEIYKIKTNILSNDDVSKAKEQIKTNYILELESTNTRMSALGREQLLMGYIETPEEIIQKIERVTRDEVVNIANKILVNTSLSAVGNIGDLDLENMMFKY